MQNDFVHLGECLKRRRQERNLSLKEVESATSIRMSYLESIEEGHLKKLISPFYAQGFIKKYAAFLELDGENLMREHPYVLKALNEKSKENNDFTLALGSVEVRGTPGGELKWLPNLLWVGISAIVILLGWLIAHYFELI